MIQGATILRLRNTVDKTGNNRMATAGQLSVRTLIEQDWRME